MNRTTRWLTGVVLVGLAGFAGTAAADVDVRIGLGVPIGAYYYDDDYYVPSYHVHEYYSPRPVYHYYDYRPSYRYYSGRPSYRHHHHHHHHYRGDWDRRDHHRHWRGDGHRWNDRDRHWDRDGRRGDDGRSWRERFHDRHHDRD